MPRGASPEREREENRAAPAERAPGDGTFLGGDAAAGAAAGLAATVPMTGLLLAGYRLLPPDEQYPLPPAEIMAAATGVTPRGPLSDAETSGVATLAGHFGYGAFTGAFYGLLLGRTARRSSAAALGTGALWGAAVWAGSYLGWVPAAGLLAPATKHPPGRSALLCAANVFQGAVTALLVRRLVS